MADFAWNDHYSCFAPLSRWLARRFIEDWAETVGDSEAELKWKEKYILGSPHDSALELELMLKLKPELKNDLKKLEAEIKKAYCLEAEIKKGFCLEELEKQSEKYLTQWGVSDKAWGGYENSLVYAVAQSADMEEVYTIVRGTIDKDY